MATTPIDVTWALRMGAFRVTFQWFAHFLYISLMTLRKKSLALGSTITLAGGATGASLLAMLMAATPAGAVGTTYTVDTLDDGAENASDCTTPVAGSCSLRDAIDSVLDGDTIVFAAGLTGTITLDAAQGQLKVNNEVLIQGPGADLLTINAGGNSRVFYLCAGPTMELSGLTITGGSDSKGGGLYDGCSDGFTLRDVVVTGNEATNGNGGGVFSSETVTLINTVVSNNTSSEKGGGVSSGGLIMEGSTISGNSAGLYGGAGGAYTSGDVSITSSTFENNSAGSCGGGLYTGVDGGTITITDSTFSNNTADNCYGGGIDIDGNDNIVIIANTTITGNSALTGGGLHVDAGNLVSLFMTTVSGNSATNTNPLYSGGGVHIAASRQTYSAVDLTMVGTIVSGNTAAAGPADIGFGYVNDVGPVAISADDSLIGDIDSRLTITGAGNVISTTPGLDALADNGGPTMTMALLATSPALDAGPSVIPTFIGNEFDQRGAGFARVVGTKSDIGAFEAQAPEPTPTTVPGGEVVPNFTG
jgi:hypothetical protein